jgi:hypothetical protein
MTRRAWNVVWATVIIGVPVALLVLPIRRSENATPTARVTSAQIAFLRNTCRAVVKSRDVV